MLKYLLTLLGLFFAGVIGFLAHYQPGHLALTYNQTMIEVPLWLAFLLMLGFVIIVFLVHAIVDRLYRVWQWMLYTLRHWHVEQQQAMQLALSRFLQEMSIASQATDDPVDTIDALWREAPRSFRYHPEALLLYAETLQKHGQAEKAELVLREGLDKVWYDSWARLYGLITIPEPGNQLKKAEKWQRKHPTNAVLLLTLGRLSIRNQLWGKAKSYLEQSIANVATAEAYAELGRLHEFLGEFSTGESLYKQGLLTVIGQGAVVYPTNVPAELKPARSFFNKLIGHKTSVVNPYYSPSVNDRE